MKCVVEIKINTFLVIFNLLVSFNFYYHETT
jgi:hypothetical protein